MLETVLWIATLAVAAFLLPRIHFHYFTKYGREFRRIRKETRERQKKHRPRYTLKQRAQHVLECCLVLFVALPLLPFVLLWRSFAKWVRRGSEPESSESKMLRFAEVLLSGDRKTYQLILEAHESFERFIEKYEPQDKYRDLQLGELIQALKASAGDRNDEKLYLVIGNVLEQKQLLGYADWKEDYRDAAKELRSMLAKKRIDDFDWSFIERLERSDLRDGLTITSFLRLFDELLGGKGYRLAFINNFSDGYGYAVVSNEDFGKISDIDVDGCFSVGQFLTADKSYEDARRILSATRA